jgi:L-asparaginase / beta-aspartyl-peptidase
MSRRAVLLGVLMSLVSAASSLGQESRPERPFALALHGGAGVEPARLSDDDRRRYEASLTAALEVGEKVLRDGGTALEAVEQTIRMMEDDPVFNAGRGSVFNHVGKHELDASIMDGRTRQAGAVASVRTVKNPITLARLVMTRTRHVLLSGDGAEHFADELRDVSELERVKNDYFNTEFRRRQWEEAVRKEQAADEARNDRGTVGCVALDRHGNLAAGTSTGGMTNKKWGRIGDSPIIGAGTYADNTTCAVSCTGTGEFFIRDSIAFHVAALMAYKGMSLDEATEHAIEKVLPADTGGLIALDARGNISMRFNTAGMSRASVDTSGRREVKVGK